MHAVFVFCVFYLFLIFNIFMIVLGTRFWLSRLDLLVLLLPKLFGF